MLKIVGIKLNADIFQKNILDTLSECQKVIIQIRTNILLFGSRSGPTFCWSRSGSNLFEKFISR